MPDRGPAKGLTRTDVPSHTVSSPVLVHRSLSVFQQSPIYESTVKSSLLEALPSVRCWLYFFLLPLPCGFHARVTTAFDILVCQKCDEVSDGVWRLSPIRTAVSPVPSKPRPALVFLLFSLVHFLNILALLSHFSEHISQLSQCLSMITSLSSCSSPTNGLLISVVAHVSFFCSIIGMTLAPLVFV